MDWFTMYSRILLFSSFLIASSTGDFSTGAIQAIRCMLLQTATTDCSTVPEDKVPIYLVKAYNDGPTSLHEALRSGQLAQLANAEVANLPLTLIYLIPRGRLTDLNGAQLAAILQKHADDTSIARQLTASIVQPKQLLDLILKLKRSALPQNALQILGEAIELQDLNQTLRSLPLKEPFLAYLRPNVMLQLSVNTGFDMLLHLQGIPPPKWASIYLIAAMAIRNNFPLAKINWLLSGLSPDEIKSFSLQAGINYNHFKLELTVAQTRAIFEQIYENKTLSKSDLIDCLQVLSKLTPSMLQRFPAQDFSSNLLLKLPLPQSLPISLQIHEYVKADCQLTAKLPKEDDEEWEFRIRYLGPWVSNLPLVKLEEYLEEPLKTADLREIESPALSEIQAYYLTGKGQSLDIGAPNTVKILGPFLRALPAAQFLSHSIGDIIMHVVEHLVATLPANNLPRTLALVYRTSVIGEEFILENLLENRDINQIISLVSPKELRAAAPRMLKWFKNKYEFAAIIRQLPQQVLAGLLEEAQKSEDWSWQNMLDKSHESYLLVGGLTCQHINQMESGLFIPIMAEYNRNRKQHFPRNLQICCLQKLIAYLKFKMAITQTDPSLGLISLLEPVEIESVGGYVLAGLPVEALRVSPYLGHILTTIGKLSNAELIWAANMTQLQSIAQLAVDTEGKADAYVVNNLVWFLPSNFIVTHFKLMLQSGLLDTTLCLPQEHRRSLALNLMAVFGPPEAWSMGVLATLQDLLLVFTDEELGNVSKTAWTDAADTLTSHYGDNINWIKPTPFHQVCASFLEESEEAEYNLAVRRLVRWRLQAAQWLLDTVELPPHASGHKIKTDIKPLDYYDMDETDATPVGVFNPSEEEESSSTFETSSMETSTISTTIETTQMSTTERTTQTSTYGVVPSTEKEVVLSENSSNTKQEEKTSPIFSTTPKSNINENISNTNVIETNKTFSTHHVAVAEDNNGKTKGKNDTQSLNDVVLDESSNKINLEEKFNNQNKTAIKKGQNNTNETKSNVTSLSTQPFSLSPTNVSTTLNSSQTTSVKILNGTQMHNQLSGSNLNNLSPNLNMTRTENETENPHAHIHEKSNKTISKSTSNSTNDNHFFDKKDDISEVEEDFNQDDNSILEKHSNSKIIRKRRDVDTSNTITQLSCNALRMVGPLSGMALTEKDLQSMTDSEVEECRVELGAMELSLQIRKDLWKRIDESKKLVGTHLLGGLLQAATVGDMWDMGPWDVKHPWVLENVHAFIKNVNDTTVLKKIVEEVQNSNSEFPQELLAVLGDSLCLLDTLTTLKPPVFGLQPSTDCPPCLPFFAKRAVEELGPVSDWTPYYVHALNYIVAGLELNDWKTLTESSLMPLSALQPSAITCLNNSHLEILTPDQIEMIPTLTLHALLPQQIAALNTSQIQVLRTVTQVSIEETLTPTKTLLIAGVPDSGPHILASALVIFTNLIFVVSRSLYN